MAETTTLAGERRAAPAAAPAIRGLHHVAYRCRDAEETRRFYEDVLGMPLVDVIRVENTVSTTGDRVSFAHFFFEMTDGSMIAFFDLGDGRTTAPDPATPAFVNHIAFTVDGEPQLLDLKRRLEAAGVPVDGPMTHEFVRSIYFWDPNGVRMEFAYTPRAPEDKQAAIVRAHENLRRWRARTAAAG
jgi:catechol 2,3-dioxygenase-like lactoylglutathione lyase family enzyme